MKREEMPFWTPSMQWVMFTMMFLAFTGCSRIQVKEVPRSVTGIEAGDFITVVLDFQGGSPQKAVKLEKNIGDCISDAMAERNLSVRFMHPGEFRRAAFPDMDITSAPRTRESILILLRSSQFRNTIKSLNLRYLVTVRERTMSTQEPVFEGGGYPPVLIFGGVIQGKSTELVADIIDLQKASDSGEVRATVEDSGVYGVVVILPVVVPAITESRACKALGRAVTKFLLGEKNDELPK